MKTLIVDDDAVSRAVLGLILKDYGAVIFAGDGKQGLETFTEALSIGKPFDVVFLDIEMPKMNGQETLLRMRSLEQAYKLSSDRQAKIIMETGRRDAASKLDASLKGCDGYLIKPYTRTEVASIIKKLSEIEF